MCNLLGDCDGTGLKSPDRIQNTKHTIPCLWSRTYGKIRNLPRGLHEKELPQEHLGLLSSDASLAVLRLIVPIVNLFWSFGKPCTACMVFMVAELCSATLNSKIGAAAASGFFSQYSN